MRTLQRYTLKEVWAPTLIALGFFTFVALLERIFKMAELLAAATVSFPLMVKLIGVITVSLISVTIPMAALLGVLIGIGRLTRENEILAIRTAGVRLLPVFRPLLAASLLVSLLVSIASAYFLPGLLNEVQKERYRISFEVLTRLKPKQFYTNLAPENSSLSLYFEEQVENPRGESSGESPYRLEMKGVSIRAVGLLGDLPSGSGENARSSPWAEMGRQTEVLIFASSGTIEGNLDTRTLRLTLENGTLLPLTRRGGQAALITFERLSHEIRPDEDEDNRSIFRQRDPRLLNLEELLTLVEQPPLHVVKYQKGDRRISRVWRDYYAVRNELYSRFLMPFSTFAFTLAAIALAISLRPRGASISFVVAMALIVLYYGLQSWASEVGITGSTWTWLAMLMPNTVVALIGAVLFWRAQRY